MVLVDTSVWIADSATPGFLVSHVAPGDVTTCLPVIQEVLQGAREQAYRVLRATLLNLPILESPISIEVFEEAVEIYRTGRSLGISIRSSFDCLIAACAIRNGVPLLHCDRDFSAIARFTRLQSRYVLP